MKLPVLVEPVPGKGFVARVSAPFNWSAEGTTFEEAVANLQAEAVRRVASGSRVESIELATADDNPWLGIIGTWEPDDPVIDEWLQGIKANRRALDNDPDAF